MTDHPQELEFRRRWYRAHVERFDADAEAVADQRKKQEGFVASAPEALALRDQLRATGELQSFAAATQAWAVKPTTLAFNNPIGQMLLNQLAKRSDDPAEASRALSEALTLPTDDDDAVRRIDALVDYIESIRVGAHPAPGRVPFVASYWWGLEDHEHWPVIWPSAASFVEFVVGESLPTAPAARYRRYRELVRQLDDDVERFERVGMWWEATKPVFLDSVLIDRCAFGRDDANDLEARAANASALVSVARHIGAGLLDDLTRTAGRTLRAVKPPLGWTSEVPRGDLWADWLVNEDWGLGLRLWINHRGVSFGLRPGRVDESWYERVGEMLVTKDVPGFRLLGVRDSRFGEDVEHAGRPWDITYARWYEPADLAALDLRAEAVATTAALQPLLDELVQLATGEPPPDPDDPLAPVVEWFLAIGYPTPADEEHRADRQRFAALVAEDNIALADLAELRQIWNTGRYGGPGPQSVLNISFRDADAAEYDRIIEVLEFLCWGEDPVEERIDKVLDDDSFKVKGLGESVIMKLLSITHPERFVPVYPYSGPKGKRRMLQLLELDEPDGTTRGQLQVRANDLLRDRLDRFFPGDPWGMAQFLYRYSEREAEPTSVDEADPLDALADELLVERSFLDDIVVLLQDKGQVILYGPPGTGKTYLARKLAEALVPDHTRRSLVQFHPSTSYEDFFEGYRPETEPGGAMTYRLTQGPLAMIADRARDAPGKRHIMIIDEINRANLPKVLGELLFLLEYRNESVRTLYRPEDAFELPEDLWFIGTMNTADRSIALIDAALRRRFHFIPFFPNQGPMEGLLARWLERKNEPGWVAELVAMVNDELIEALGGPHLQLGPSYFMKKGLNEEQLRLIWQYNIEPFIEDQFFGDPVQIEHFRFATVLKRFRDEVGSFVATDEVAVAPAAASSIPTDETPP